MKVDLPPWSNHPSLLLLVGSTLVCIVTSLVFLNTGYTIIFQNLYYIPIIIACFYYTRRGFLFSGLLSLTYFTLVMVYTRDIGIVQQAGMRVIFFVGIAGVVTFLSEEVRRSEGLLQRLTDFQENIITNARVWLMVLDKRGTIHLWNTAAERISGYTQDEVVGKNSIWKLLYPEASYRGQITETIHHIIRTQKEFENFETAILTKTGEERIISWNTKELPPAHGERQKFIAIGVDVTERRHSEQELRKSEERWAELFSKNMSAIAIYKAVDDGSDFIFVDINPAVELFEQIRREDVIGKRVTEIFPAIEEFGLLLVFRRVYSTGKPEKHDISLYKDNRIQGWRENIVYQLSTGELVATYTDVTERKQAEALIREKNDYLENLISIANVPIIIWDTSLLVTRLNHACEHLIGRMSDDVIGKSIEMLIPPDQTDRSMRLFRTTTEGVRLEAVKMDILRKDGSIRTVLWNSATLYSQDGDQPVVTIAQGRDITDEIRLEQEKDAALVQIQKNLAQLAVLNDEIRNPLAVIMGYVDLYEDKEYEGEIVEQVQRVNDIVTNLDKRWIQSEKVLNAIRKHYNLFVPGSETESGQLLLDQLDELSDEITEQAASGSPLLPEEIQAELYMILDSIDAVIYVADMETYDLLYLNNRGRMLYGDIAGRKCHEALFNATDVCSFCTNRHLLDGSGPVGVYSWEVKNPKTGRWYDCRDRAIRWPNGRMVRLEIATDITERKETEETLRQTIEDLRDFNALTAGRELRLRELKKEVNSLLLASGKEEKYTLDK